MARVTHRWTTRILASNRTLWTCSKCGCQAETPLWMDGPSTNGTRPALQLRRASAGAKWERYSGSLGLACGEVA